MRRTEALAWVAMFLNVSGARNQRADGRGGGELLRVGGGRFRRWRNGTMSGQSRLLDQRLGKASGRQVRQPGEIGTLPRSTLQLTVEHFHGVW